MFDLGGVLVKNDMFKEFPNLMLQQINESELKEKLLLSKTFRQFELGECSSNTFASSMVNEFQLTSTPAEFLDTFTSWPKGFYTGAKKLLLDLSAQNTLVCLSNSNALHWTSEITSPFNFSHSSHLMNHRT